MTKTRKNKDKMAQMLISLIKFDSIYVAFKSQYRFHNICRQLYNYANVTDVKTKA